MVSADESTRRHNPEEQHRHLHRRENPKYQRSTESLQDEETLDYSAEIYDYVFFSRKIKMDFL
jgi:hypothetical protein